MLIVLNNHKCSSFFYEDAKYSYKQAYGYFPGVVSIDGIIAYIENRDGNCRIFYIRAIHSASMYSRIQIYAMQVRCKYRKSKLSSVICHWVAPILQVG